MAGPVTDTKESCEPLAPIGDGGRRRLARFIPLALLAFGGVTAWLTGIQDHLTIETIAEYRQTALVVLADHGLVAGGIFVGALIMVAAFSIPAVGLMNVAAGFLFGTAMGTAYAIVGQTIGAVVIFVAIRLAFRDIVSRVPVRQLRRMERGFQRHAFVYMIVLRLAPFMPAWLVNIVPGLLGVSLRTYTVGTLVGVVPCTFVFSSMGNGLGAIMDDGITPDLSIMTRPELLIPLVGLTVLALMPVLIRRWMRDEDGSDKSEAPPALAS
jgi:uncharacterized membrane protein YdjX (TVP38/TMEM64 family)